ncbi:MAG: hypothetical protein PVF33_13105 [Candidatus Latescibacterota bacterium]|jgi:chromosome segregation ATPase
MNKVLVILIVAACATTGYLAWDGWGQTKAAKAGVAEYERELKDVREKLSETNIKYRGLTDSLKDIPTEQKKEMTGEYLRKERTYRKQLLGYEERERDTTRQLKKRERQLEAVRKAVRNRLVLSGGVALVLAGALAVRRAKRP